VLYTTREPQDRFGGHAALTLGDYGRHDAQAVINIPLTDTLAARLGASYSKTDGYLRNIFYDPATGERNATPGLGSRKLAGLFSVKLQPDDSFKLVVRGDFDTEHHTGVAYHSLSAFEGTVRSTGAVGSTPTPVSRPSICNIPLSCNQFTDLNGRVSGPYFSDAQSRVLNGSPLAYNTTLASLARVAGDFWAVDQAVNLYNVGHFQSVSAVAEKTAGDLEVRLLGGYRWFDTFAVTGARGAPYNSLQGFTDEPDYDAYTAELTVNGKGLRGALKWTAGAFFFLENSATAGSTSLLSVNQTGAQPISGRQITQTNTAPSGENRSYAAFAQATYDLRPDLRLTAGLRFTIDQRRAHLETTSVRFPATAATTATVRNSVFDPGSYSLNGITYTGVTRSCGLTEADGTLRPVDACFFDVKAAFRKPTWSVSLDYDLADGTLIYFTSRKGYRSGAINTGATNAGITVAKPENVQDFELGLKSDWSIGGVPVRTGAAAFFTRYRDIQIQYELPYVVFAVGPSGERCTQSVLNAGQCQGFSTSSVTLNAKAADLYGGEWEISARPLQELTLSWNGSYLHTRYTDFSFAAPPGYLQPVVGTNLTGKPFPLPAWMMSWAATFALPGARLGLPVEELALTGTVFYQGPYKTELTGYNPAQKVKGYALANLRLDARNMLGRNIDLSVQVSNLFDRKACIAEPGGSGAGLGAGVLTSTPNPTFGVPNTSGVIQCAPMPPRMVAVTLKHRF
jgi:iron complex outermembrane receptor protein